MKKQIARGMVIMLGILAMLTGCTREEIPEYHGETEYFQYAYVLSTGDSPAMSFAEENGKYVGKYVGIGELTELGKQQKELIIPKMIDGMQVIYLNYYISKLYFPREKYITSDVLEKIYLPNTIKEIHDSVEGGLYSCPNLKAVIYNSIC